MQLLAANVIVQSYKRGSNARQKMTIHQGIFAVLQPRGKHDLPEVDK